MRVLSFVVIALLLLFIGCVGIDTETKTPPPPPPPLDSKIKIASFNIQVFGKTKAEKQEVMAVLANIVRNFDIVAVQEIRDASQTALPALRDAVNALGSPKYEFM